MGGAPHCRPWGVPITGRYPVTKRSASARKKSGARDDAADASMVGDGDDQHAVVDEDLGEL
jgi:hypothetical protein